jgi:hypothetical protein
MGGWLSRKSEKFRRRDRDPPAEFAVWCACGTICRGFRRQQHQEITCPACLRTVFVLPATPYPAPAAAPAATAQTVPRPSGATDKSPSRKPIMGAAASTERLEVDSPASIPPGEKRRRTATDVPTARSAVASASKAVSPRTPRITRYHGALFFTLAAIVTMAWGLARQQQRIQARAAAAVSERLAREALAQHDYAEAAAQFRRAREAVELLGRTDRDARWIIQMEQETAVITGRSPLTLTEIVAEGAAAREANTLDEWLAQFPAQYGRFWIVLDTTMPPEVTPEGAARWLLPGTTGGERLQVQLRSYDRLHRQRLDPGAPRIILGAKMGRCQYWSDARLWVLELDSPSAFLWADSETYAEIAFDVDPATADVLKVQTASLGLAQTEPAP